MSYPQYSRYEAGEQLPSLSQALSIGRALETPLLTLVLEWNMAQLEDEPDHAEALRELRALVRKGAALSSEASVEAPTPVPVQLDEVIVFNRSHRALFMKDSAYRDVFTFVNSLNGRLARYEDISETLRIPGRKLAPMLENLVELGVILKEGDAYVAAKRNFYFPDDEDFFELRHRNLRHDLEDLLGKMTYPDIAGKRAFRSLVTRELSAGQFAWLLGQMEGVLRKSVELPEDPGARTIYSICAVMGERFPLP